MVVSWSKTNDLQNQGNIIIVFPNHSLLVDVDPECIFTNFYLENTNPVILFIPDLFSNYGIRGCEYTVVQLELS